MLLGSDLIPSVCNHTWLYGSHQCVIIPGCTGHDSIFSPKYFLLLPRFYLIHHFFHQTGASLPNKKFSQFVLESPESNPRKPKFNFKLLLNHFAYSAEMYSMQSSKVYLLNVYYAQDIREDTHKKLRLFLRGSLFSGER